MRNLIIIAVATVIVACYLPAQAELTLANPDWSIVLSDHGYADVLLDKTPGREGREYLSGEWAASLGYKVGAAPVTAPVWLEPDFAFPTWTTNSDFLVVTPITAGPLNGFGLPTASSEIANADLSVLIDYEMLNSVIGIEQGAVPAGVGGAGGFVTSGSRFILNQTYTITNISGEEITELNAFQFLHSLNSDKALYDDRDYGGPFGAYHYDTFEVGTSVWLGDILEDVITFHSDIEPTAWEVGYYGSEIAGDSHTVGKPGVGVHLSIETDTLSGVDLFAPPDSWVGGAQRYALAATLPAGSSTSFDVLLSISTSTEVIPEPCTLVVLGLGSLALLRRKRG